MRRLASLVALLLLAGCPGDLENADQYPSEPLELCQLDLDVPALFQSKCGTSACHAGSEPKAELDLVSPGVYERMVNVPATQCDGRVRVDPREPNASFLIEKLRGTQPAACGDRMPFVSFLTGAEIACVQRWVFDQSGALDGGRPPAADAGADDEDGGATVEDGSAGTDDAGADVDCSPFEASGNFELCTARADGCDVNATMNTSCATTCAVAGLTCARVFDNVDGMCAANMEVPGTCDDDTKADIHCVCE